MPKILVNYKYNKKNDKYSLLENEVVFADMPIAEMDMGTEFDEVLVVPINGRNTVVEKEEYLKVNKLFKLVSDKDGNVTEDANGVPVWLPKDTNIEQLKFINGQLVLVEPTEETKEGE